MVLSENDWQANFRGTTCLKIKQAKYMVSLGCTPKERATLQPILISIDFKSNSIPAGAFSDKLSDAICYQEVMTGVTRLLEGESFELVEHLGLCVYDWLKKLPNPILKESKIKLLVHKCHPPVATPNDGVDFEISEFES